MVVTAPPHVYHGFALVILDNLMKRSKDVIKLNTKRKSSIDEAIAYYIGVDQKQGDREANWIFVQFCGADWCVVQ